MPPDLFGLLSLTNASVAKVRGDRWGFEAMENRAFSTFSQNGGTGGGEVQPLLPEVEFAMFPAFKGAFQKAVNGRLAVVESGKLVPLSLLSLGFSAVLRRQLASLQRQSNL